MLSSAQGHVHSATQLAAWAVRLGPRGCGAGQLPRGAALAGPSVRRASAAPRGARCRRTGPAGAARWQATAAAGLGTPGMQRGASRQLGGPSPLADDDQGQPACGVGRWELPVTGCIVNPQRPAAQAGWAAGCARTWRCLAAGAARQGGAAGAAAPAALGGANPAAVPTETAEQLAALPAQQALQRGAAGARCELGRRNAGCCGAAGAACGRRCSCAA
jgi:hypothetical protein